MSSSIPPDGARPEYLEQGAGVPVTTGATRTPGRKGTAIAGGAIAGLVLVGGGVWAATWYLGSGPQPAEALPASTLGYVSVDLDPSGDQKIEAVRTLNKFPALEEELDLEIDDDIKQRLFDQLGLGEACDGLDYAEDVEPWLGDRAALAAIDLGEDEPAPVGVLQVKDADAAQKGLTILRECDGGDAGGWAFEGEWAVVAETDAIAADVVAETAAAPLADDEDHQGWVDEVGDAGVLSMYVAPEAGDLLADQADAFWGLGSSGVPHEGVEHEGSGATAEMPGDEPGPTVSDEMRQRLADFEGMAMTVRFDDGAVELEMAGGAALSSDFLPVTDGADDVLATLPSDTAVAFGIGLADGWFTETLEQLASMSGMDVEELIAEGEAETGLELPEDVETLLGDSTAVAISGDFDPATFFSSADGTDVPIGFKVKGNPSEIEGVLSKVREQISASGGPELVTKAEGDTIAIGLDDDYVDTLSADGGLGDSEVYQNVVREPGAASVIAFIDFDAGTDWLVESVGGDQRVAENVAPLEGFGLSSWLDGDVTHTVVRLTTD